MSPSLDNDCTIQDLAFQVLKLFGVKNFNIRPLPRIMSFMTWSSKTWTQVNIFVKTWQPQVWNLTLFQDLACQVLNCFTFELHVPKSWQWLFKTWLSKSWNVWVTPWTILWWACFLTEMFIAWVCHIWQRSRPSRRDFWLFDVCCWEIWMSFLTAEGPGLHHMQPWQEEGWFTSLSEPSA